MSALPMDLTVDPSANPQVFIALARDKSTAGRLRLIETLADTYLQPDRALSDFEAGQLDAFVDEIFKGSVPLDVRQLLARRAAQAKTISPALVKKIVTDEIEVAGPFLKDCNAIEDRDLLTVIGLKRTPHRMAIAGRAAVSEAVADALVLTGDVAIVETLLKNFGARLSRISIARCVELAKQLQALRLPLVNRQEFTAADASQLLWWLPRELRQIVSDRFGPLVAEGMSAGVSARVENRGSVATSVDGQLQIWAANPPRGAEAVRAALWLAERNAVDGVTLTRVLRLKLPNLFVAMLAQHTGLALNLVERVCSALDKGGQVFAVICRAMNIDKAQFASLFMLTHSMFQGGRALAPTALGQILGAYDRIGPRAGPMLQAWRENPELLKARI